MAMCLGDMALGDENRQACFPGAALTFLLGFVQAAAGAAHGAAYNPDHAYTFGLQRAIDGLGALIDASGA